MEKEFKFVGTELDLVKNGFCLSNSMNGYKNKIYHKRILNNGRFVEDISIFIVDEYISFIYEDSLEDLIEKGLIIQRKESECL